MIGSKFVKLFFIILCAVASNHVMAGAGVIGPVYLESVGVIGNSAFGHLPGNLEIKISGSVTIPAGMTCDTQGYFTTRNTSPGYNQMVSLLLAAQLAQKPVQLGISDDPNLAAWGGRCSLVAVTILK